MTDSSEQNQSEKKQWLVALACACIFLTRLPMPFIQTITPEDQGRSLATFPIVGLIIGLLLLIVALLSNTVFSSIVTAAIIVAFWAAITGGLHLDGLADSADGWLGGLGDIDRTLEIMHDSRSGAAAVVAVACLLILKFAALVTIVEAQVWQALLIAPILGRCVAPLLFIPGINNLVNMFYTPYVQPTGIANDFIDYCPKQVHYIVLAAITFCFIISGHLVNAIIVIGVSALVLKSLRHLMLKRLNGSTGDTAGAATEIIETIVLILAGALLI